MTSVALLIESTKLSLHPYKLSNLDLVTESFTLIAGINNLLSFSNFFKALTPVVVSSETPLIFFYKSLYLSWIIIVRSPPSSNKRFGFQSLFPLIVCSIHHQYSSSVSPFHAKTGMPFFAIAAAA